MNDLSKLIVGVAAGVFVAFGLYYGVVLKNNYQSEENIDEKIARRELTEDISLVQSIEETVLSKIYSNPDLSRFSFLSQKISIEKEFEKNSKLTLFVPSNQAMLSKGVGEKLDQDDSQSILKFINSHIINQKIDVNDIKSGQTKSYQSMSGIQIEVSRDQEGNLLVQGNKINSVENNATDGIFYIIDFAILEKSLIPVPDDPSIIKPSVTPSMGQ